MDNTEFDAAFRETSRYKFWCEDHVRFNDLDALGHVNSVRTNEYFAGARTALFLQAIPDWPKSKLVPVLKLNIVRYDAEIHFPQNLKIGLCVEKFGNTSFSLVMGLFGDEKCLSLCRSLFVFIDTATRKSATPDEGMKQRFLHLAG